VVISHDHYDHLDRATIATLAKSKARFVVPLGVAAFLRAWGISDTRITELDWWQSAPVGTLQIVATPSRHHSGRLSPQSDLRLWTGYAFVGERHRVWYSGDTGFSSALAEIGKRFGPFDVTLIEAGQYDAAWPDWHLGPEQAVEASRLVGGKKMIPVHWGLLQLAHHSWTEPAERVLAAAACRGVEVIVPRPGESVEPTAEVTLNRWWPQTAWRDASQTPIVATHHGLGSDRYVFEPCATAAH
jgi:L-ascorbate metabolism protein UlaG (beta-lactamase superfamily)